MLKKILEQSYSIQQTIDVFIHKGIETAFFEDLNLSIKELKSINRILILGSGSSWHAGCIAASLLENIARIPTAARILSEFLYTNPVISEDTLVIIISQKREVADNLAAIRKAKAKKAKVIGICDVNNSAIFRESDGCIFLKQKLKINVCSTKLFTIQLMLLFLFSLFMARIRYLDEEREEYFLKELSHIPRNVEEVIAKIQDIKELAEKYASFNQFFFLGRRYMFPISLELALELNKIGRFNACGYAAGEMKHGPLALVNSKLAVIGMCGNMQTKDKILNNLVEIISRGGSILAFVPVGVKEFEKISSNIIYLPKINDFFAPIPYFVAGQILIYYIAKKLNIV